MLSFLHPASRFASTASLASTCAPADPRMSGTTHVAWLVVVGAATWSYGSVRQLVPGEGSPGSQHAHLMCTPPSPSLHQNEYNERKLIGLHRAQEAQVKRQAATSSLNRAHRWRYLTATSGLVWRRAISATRCCSLPSSAVVLKGSNRATGFEPKS